MMEYKYQLPIKEEFRKWSEFHKGDIIASESEIGDFISGIVQEENMKRFIIVDGQLWDFPNMGQPYTGSTLKFGKICSITKL